jgi:hypothetical protein
MTATYGRKFADWYLSSDPTDACLKTLLGTSTWGSMTCYLTWKKSGTPQGRLLFRLVPSTPRTAGIGSGLWGTPTSRDHMDGSSVANVPENGLLGRQVVNRQMLHTPTGTANQLSPSMATRDAGSWGLERRIPLDEMPFRNGAPDVPPGEVWIDEHGIRYTAPIPSKLNSAWVSRMMGYPDDWLTLDGETTR